MSRSSAAPASADIQYAWAGGFPARGVKAQDAGEFIEALSEDAGRPVTAQEVVNSARPRKSPIHRIFEWDDAVAAEAFRCEQARGMLRNLEIHVVAEDGGEVAKRAERAFIHIQHEDADGYAHARKVANRIEWLDSALEDAREYLSGAKRRFSHIKELAGVMAAIDAFLG